MDNTDKKTDGNDFIKADPAPQTKANGFNRASSPSGGRKIYPSSADILSYSPRFDREPDCNDKNGRAASHSPRFDGKRVHNKGSGKMPADKKSGAKPVYYVRSDAAEPSGSENSGKKKKSPRKRFYRQYKNTAEVNAAGVKSNGIKDYRQILRERNIAGLKRTLIIFVILSFILLAVYGIYRLTAVGEITISGSERYDSARIKDFCGIQPGHNIFAYNFSYIKERMSVIPELTVLSVKKHFPDRIEITVTDRTPRAAIPAGNGTYTVIDSEGFVMSVGNRDTEGLLLINGLTLAGFKPGNQINLKSDSSLRRSAAFEFIKAVDSHSMQAVTAGIDVSNISCAKLILKNNFTAVLGTYPEALSNFETAKKAYFILLENYPGGGVINVFYNKSMVDFTPNPN